MVVLSLYFSYLRLLHFAISSIYLIKPVVYLAIASSFTTSLSRALYRFGWMLLLGYSMSATEYRKAQPDINAVADQQHSTFRTAQASLGVQEK